MNTSVRQMVLLAMLLAMLLLGVIWAWNNYCDSRSRWASAMAETATCRQLADAFEQYRKGADAADGTEMPENQLYQKVHQAAQATGLEESRVIRGIHPQPAPTVRVGHDKSYDQKNVELNLQRLTMEQLTAFLHHLQTDPPQLRIVALTLHDPKGMGTSTLWSVDPLVLGYRVHNTQTKKVEH